MHSSHKNLAHQTSPLKKVCNHDENIVAMCVLPKRERKKKTRQHDD
jgi:hypothetical protein